MDDFKIKLRNLLKNKDIIYSIICLIVLIIILIVGQLFGVKITQYIDIEMLTSVVAAFFLTSLASLISKLFTAKFEDTTKLTTDYNSLVKMYKANTEMIRCHNEVSEYSKLGRKSSCKGNLDDQNGDSYVIPVGDVLQLWGKPVIIHDAPDEQYVLPEFCKDHYAELFGAHDSSNTFNQINLRASKIQELDGQVHVHFTRTTYFDSLVTNRAIDFKIDGVSVRDLFAHGPYLKSLEQSPLSNHMGFNGMIETSDGEFVFIKRHGHVSIGKNTMQCSIAASLKTKHTLNENGLITKEGIARAIKTEVEDELHLNKLESYRTRKNEIFKNFSFDNNVLYFYRDLLEGGKPQLMFHAKLNLSKKELEAIWAPKKFRFLPTGKKENQRDGYKILFVSEKELQRVYLTPDAMVIKNKRYPAMPSAVATVALLKRALADGLRDPRILESFTLSKKGNYYGNEDGIFVSDRFIAVTDGVTSKTAGPAGVSISGGRFASRVICKQLEALPEISDPEEILRQINNKLKEEIAKSPYAKSPETPLASIILYDACTRKIISYGDCQALLGNRVCKREKLLDTLHAEKRSGILRQHLENGRSVQELLQEDVGRAAINRDILDSAKFANKEGTYGFPVLGTGEIVPSYIDVYSVKEGDTVILASDGYPDLAPTLAESEERLAKIIREDPLMIGHCKTTKGVASGNVSYDDRTYVRFVVSA